jgi:ABC-type transport system involved in cytochrome c biogenesis permease subunit
VTRRLLLPVGLLLAIVSGALVARGGASPVPAPWPEDVIERAARLPVQEGGRIKPLDSVAAYTLLAINHRRSVRDAADRKVGAVEWLLDVVFRPSYARTVPCFMVPNDEVLQAIGLPRPEGKKKRDRYSYDDLVPARDALGAKGREYMKIEAKKRSPVEGEVVDLFHAFAEFEGLLHFLDFARDTVDVPADAPKVRELLGGRDEVLVLEVLEHVTALRALLPKESPHGHPETRPEAAAPADPDAAAATRLLQAASETVSSATALAVIPPPAGRDASPQWITPAHVVFGGATGSALGEAQEELVHRLAAMARFDGRTDVFERELSAFSSTAVSLAEARGEYDGVELEVTLRRLDPFYRAVWLYVLAFLLLAVSWAVPNRWLTRSGWVLVLAGALLTAVGITIRCFVLHRAPISTLYDTMLFISCVGALTLLVVERMQRIGVALALAPVIGGLVLFIGNRFEVMKGEDTLRPLEAVLDTNFWLATHVTAINLGYCGGLLAALMAHVTVLGRVFRKGTEVFHRTVSRMTYGLLCFGLIFSVLGTILGGVWANDSWGRFWGWDPKENGALMICLADIAILHARMGGLIRPFGLAMATIGAGGVIAFSWWGVNLLGIGLHSYGWTAGVANGMIAFYSVEAVVLLAGGVHWLRSRARPSALPSG